MKHSIRSAGGVLAMLAALSGIGSGGFALGAEDAPLTLNLEAPSGGTVQLVYRERDGWSFGGAAVQPQRVATSLPAARATPDEGAEADKPLTVFIDGPTGYTYVWVADQGWKFVGKVTQRIR
ncbi:hypothetical protein BGLT_01932 [Caballeronia glathei]|jgi:hypothetical protein|nr:MULTISPECIES: hypothetical protein [Burkholderiaceae]TCK38860.1 hypothetical protein B0G84_4184 [Paraburkholderia sp. BL8N3]CDY79237.1 hypothetical protein BGLT_01932 [Caballeronia glathei]